MTRYASMMRRFLPAAILALRLLRQGHEHGAGAEPSSHEREEQEG